jgi:(4S)-4-hydroxy-5-phosphonooxypentane-2,3-dione isomerase
MVLVRKRSALFTPLAGCLAAAALLFAAAAGAHAQAGPDAIYGVTSLDVAPDKVAQGVALLKQYREGARKQAGNLGVDLLQEAGGPNRFVIYETWKDQAAYDANEKAAPIAELSDKAKPIVGGPPDRRYYHAISVGPVRTAMPNAVFMQVHLDVFPPGLEPALAAVRAVAEAARKDEGNLRYDVVQTVKTQLSHMTLYSGWASRKAFDDYETSAYARRFRNAVGPLLGSPYDDRLYVLIN